jgi:hypothetical protein
METITLTKKQVKEIETRKHISELLKEIETIAHSKVSKALNCGALDENLEILQNNNYLLAKAILYSMKNQFLPFSSVSKKEFDNLSIFI